MPGGPNVSAMLPVDPVLAGLLAFLLGLAFFGYLMLRRTVLGFKEGLDEGRR